MEERKRETKYGAIRERRGRETEKERLTRDNGRRRSKSQEETRVSSRSSSHFGRAFCAAAANYLITSDHW